MVLVLKLVNKLLISISSTFLISYIFPTKDFLGMAFFTIFDKTIKFFQMAQKYVKILEAEFLFVLLSCHVRFFRVNLHSKGLGMH